MINPFEPKFHGRLEFRNWLGEEFSFVLKKHPSNYETHEIKLLEENAEYLETIILDHFHTRLKKTQSAYLDYYSEDISAIKESVSQKNYQKLGESLKTLKEAIDYE